jgi:hypothetical protein
VLPWVPLWLGDRGWPRLAYNERIKWITNLCGNLAAASVVLGMLTLFLTNIVTYWFSVPVSMTVAGSLLWFSMWLLGDLLPDDER